MATVIRPARDRHSALNALIGTTLSTLRARQARRRLFKTTLRELSMLSNRELADLGLARSEIRRIAWSAAYDQ